MEIITAANETILAILKRFKKKDVASRMSCYCVQLPVEDGVLLFHTLTLELVLLTQEEYAHLATSEILRDRWFLVPENTNEKELADMVRWVLENRRKKSEDITSYTIFPTTDCNARCFYCFEMGRSRIPMTLETAGKTAEYIKAHCGGKKVNLAWFGGEPLYNQPAIDAICAILRREGIEYKSTAVSNGYLFDEATVKKAAEGWNLKHVQITLDGTEAVYNRAKAFIYREGSPYQVVLENMGRLLDAGVAVTVRLNMDLYNAQDLLDLVEELAGRFAGRKGLMVYAHHIFGEGKTMAQLHTAQEWEARETAMCRLEEKIQQCGLGSKAGLRSTVKLWHCMADSGSAVTILPGGEIGLCEHYTETEFIGHIEREGFDEVVVKSWRERVTQEPECASCCHYPTCFQLKKCANKSECIPLIRRERMRKLQQQILNEFSRWKSQETVEETEAEAFC